MSPPPLALVPTFIGTFLAAGVLGAVLVAALIRVHRGRRLPSSRAVGSAIPDSPELDDGVDEAAPRKGALARAKGLVSARRKRGMAAEEETSRAHLMAADATPSAAAAAEEAFVEQAADDEEEPPPLYADVILLPPEPEVVVEEAPQPLRPQRLRVSDIRPEMDRGDEDARPARGEDAFDLRPSI